MFPGFVNIYRDENEFIHLFFFSGIDDSGNDIYRNIDLANPVPVTDRKGTNWDSTLDTDYSRYVGGVISEI